jgi:type 1 fimbria pilin
MSRSGTPKALKLDKQNYRLAADVDFDRKPGTALESQATSGAPNFKALKQNEDIEGVDIIVSAAQRASIERLASADNAFDISYTDARGNSYTGKGFINIKADGTADAKMTITLMPENGWELILV